MEVLAYDQFRELENNHWWFLGRKAIFRHLLPLALGGDHRRAGEEPLILDLGCGVGGMLDELGGSGRVVGLDSAQEALRICKERGRHMVIRGEGLAVPLADGSLDLVTLFDTLEHIPEEMRTLQEVHRVLRPGGHVFISVPAYQWLYTNQDRLVHHQRRYTAGGLKRRLNEAGFVMVRSSYINFFLFPAILPVLLVMKLKQALWPPPQDSYFTNASFPVPRWLNRLLAGVFGFERRIVRHVRVPAGHSLLVIARKPAEGD